MNSRDAILARIRTRLGKTGSEPAEAEIASVSDHLQFNPQGFRPKIDWGDIAMRFIERAQMLNSTVDQVSFIAEVPEAIRRYLDNGGLPHSGVCWPEFAELDWNTVGIELYSRPAEEGDLLGITGAFCAIAETGTLMLLSGPAMAAGTSLLPETHIAIIRSARIVKEMEEAWGLLRLEQGKLPRAVNFISGPSRTADIEQTIVIGAHGPYRVHIILVRGS